MSLKTRLASLVSGILPHTQTRVVVRGRQQPPATAHLMDVDALHGYLRAAEAGDTAGLFGLYRDIIASHAHTQSVFSTRKLAVLNEPLNLIAADPKNAAEAALNAEVQAHLVDRPGWMRFLSHSLDSTLYPTALTERCYQPSSRPGWRYELGQMVAVPHIHLAWPEGELSIRSTTEEGVFTGEFYRPTPRTHIVHSAHLLASVPDYWGGPMRALLFWWLFATMDRDWWARFLDRFGAPFLVGKYDETDERAKYELADAFSAATRLFGLAVTKETEVTMHQANAQGGGEAFAQFHRVANDEISKLVLGQTSSADTKAVGMNGGGQATAQAEVREDIRRYDSAMLSHTIRTQILAPLWTLNGWSSPLPAVIFGATDAEDADLTGDLLVSLFNSDLEVADEDLPKLSAKLGLSLRRKQHAPDAVRIPLSADPTRILVPAAARRAARQRQARGAVDAVVASASPRLARIMHARASAFADALAAADSPDEAESAVAELTSAYDPGIAADLISAVLTAASANAVISLD